MTGASWLCWESNITGSHQCRVRFAQLSRLFESECQYTSSFLKKGENSLTERQRGAIWQKDSAASNFRAFKFSLQPHYWFEKETLSLADVASTIFKLSIFVYSHIIKKIRSLDQYEYKSHGNESFRSVAINIIKYYNKFITCLCSQN